MIPRRLLLATVLAAAPLSGCHWLFPFTSREVDATVRDDHRSRDLAPSNGREASGWEGGTGDARPAHDGPAHDRPAHDGKVITVATPSTGVLTCPPEPKACSLGVNSPLGATQTVILLAAWSGPTTAQVDLAGASGALSFLHDQRAGGVGAGLAWERSGPASPYTMKCIGCGHIVLFVVPIAEEVTPVPGSTLSFSGTTAAFSNILPILCPLAIDVVSALGAMALTPSQPPQSNPIQAGSLTTSWSYLVNPPAAGGQLSWKLSAPVSCVLAGACFSP